MKKIIGFLLIIFTSYCFAEGNIKANSMPANAKSSSLPKDNSGAAFVQGIPSAVNHTTKTVFNNACPADNVDKDKIQLIKELSEKLDQKTELTNKLEKEIEDLKQQLNKNKSRI